MVPNLVDDQYYNPPMMPMQNKRSDLPKCLFDAADVISVPVMLNDIFLSDRDTIPPHVQNSDSVNIVLNEFNLLSAVVTSRPLSQSPFLDDKAGFLEFNIFTVHVSVKYAKLSTNFSTVKPTRSSTSEGSKAIRVGKGGVKLLGGGTELVRGVHGDRVDG